MPKSRGPLVFLVLALLVLFAMALMVRRYLGAVVLAMTAGYLLWPIHNWLEQHLPKRWPAAALVLFMLTVILVAPLAILVLVFVEDAARVVAGINSRQDVEDHLVGFFSGLGIPRGQLEMAVERIVEEAAAYLQGAAVSILSDIAHFAIAAFIFFILLFYVLLDGPRLVHFLTRSVPAPPHQVQHVLVKVGERTKAIVYGTVGVAFVQAAIATAGWWLLGLPNPVFWGFVILILSVVPVLGAFVVLLPAAILAFVRGDILVGVGLSVLNFVMVGLIDDILRPYIIGRRSGVHPALVLLGIVGGIPLFGLAGIILGPLLMGLAVPLWEAWAHPDAPASA